MKITFLGTAAAEAMPATFCNCKYCTEVLVEGKGWLVSFDGMSVEF
jgi:phosphoribosyl 1,2-cyclic phosphodiesterase